MKRAQQFATQFGLGLAGFALAMLSKGLEPLPGLVLLLVACVLFGLQIRNALVLPESEELEPELPGEAPQASPAPTTEKLAA